MIHTKVDNLGRIVIPKKYRDALGLDENPNIEISLAGGLLIIAPSKNLCRLCGRIINEPSGIALCPECITTVKNT